MQIVEKNFLFLEAGSENSHVFLICAHPWCFFCVSDSSLRETGKS